MNKIIITLLLIFSILAFAKEGGKVAIVQMKRGDVKVVLADGSEVEVKKGDWITEGSLIKTADKSFCKLSFIDKSSMNVGPQSEMKIEKFDKKEAGVINVLSGKIRSKVTKDYLEMDKDKSKLFVRSKASVMGVRGTDFMFSVNKNTNATTAVLFEGSIVFNKISEGDNLKNLEDIVNRGRKINPGEFSIVNANLNKPTVPAKMNSTQLKGLQNNLNLSSDNKKTDQKEIKRSVVPPGLSGEVVAGEEKGLKADLQKIVKIDPESQKMDKEKIKDTKGFVRGNDVRPPDGAIVHIDSGTIIPLGSDSKFDNNKKEWVSSSVGSIDNSGDYIPPKGFKITDEGILLKVDKISGKELRVNIEVRPVDQQAPLDALPTKEFKPREIINKVNEDPKVLVSNPFVKECSGSTCLPPPPVCEGCGIVPPTFQSGTIKPGDTTQTQVIRPRTPVQIRVNKK